MSTSNRNKFGIWCIVIIVLFEIILLLTSTYLFLLFTQPNLPEQRNPYYIASIETSTTTQNDTNSAYRNVLSCAQQETYNGLENSLRNMERFYPIEAGILTPTELRDVIVSILYDNPDICWIGSEYIYVPWVDGTVAGVSCEYLLDEADAFTIHAKLLEQATSTIAQMYNEIGVGASDADKIRWLYDDVALSLEYGENHFDQTALAFFFPDMASKTRCAGYAKAFKVLCDTAGIECYCVRGSLFGEGDPHVWNMVRTTDGAIYYVESTWGKIMGEEEKKTTDMWCTDHGEAFSKSEIPDTLSSQLSIVTDGKQQTQQQHENAD